MRIRAIAVVARHEFLSNLLSWSFLGLVFGLPLMWVVFGGVAGGIAAYQELKPAELTLLDRTGVLAEEVTSQTGALVTWAELPTDATPETLDAQVIARTLDGWVLLDDRTLVDGTHEVRALASTSKLVASALDRAVHDAALAVALGEHSVVLERFDASHGTTFVDLDVDPSAADTAFDLKPAASLVGLGLIFMPLLLYTSFLNEAVKKEKEEGIAEVLVCVVRPDELITGKILGIGGLAMVHLTAWTLPLLATMIALGAKTGDGATDSLAVIGGPGSLVVLFALAASGFLFIATLLAVVSAVSQKVAGWTNLAFLAAAWVAFPYATAALEDPNTPALTAASLIPPSSLFLAWPRLLGGAPAWQAWVSIVVLLGAASGLIWLAGALYRLDLQWGGSRPSLRQMWAVLRTS